MPRIKYQPIHPSQYGFLSYQETKNQQIEDLSFINYPEQFDQLIEEIDQSDKHIEEIEQTVDEEFVTSINATNIMNKVIFSFQHTTKRYQGMIKSRRCVELFTFYENKNMRNKLSLEIDGFIGIFTKELNNTITVVSIDEETVIMILYKIINRCIQLDRFNRPKTKSVQQISKTRAIPKTLAIDNKFSALDDSEIVEEAKDEPKKESKDDSKEEPSEDPTEESKKEEPVIDTENDNISIAVEKALLTMKDDEFNCFKQCVYSNSFEIKMDVDIISNKLKELDISNVILSIEDSKTDITVWTKEEQMQTVLMHIGKIVADSNKVRTFADLLRGESVSNAGKVTKFGHRWTKTKSS
jgi:hypothetical protein